MNGQNPGEPPSGGPAPHLLKDALAQRLEASALGAFGSDLAAWRADASSRTSVQQIPCARASPGKVQSFRRFPGASVSTSRQMPSTLTPGPYGSRLTSDLTRPKATSDGERLRDGAGPPRRPRRAPSSARDRPLPGPPPATSRPATSQPPEALAPVASASGRHAGPGGAVAGIRRRSAPGRLRRLTRRRRRRPRPASG